MSLSEDAVTGIKINVAPKPPEPTPIQVSAWLRGVLPTLDYPTMIQEYIYQALEQERGLPLLGSKERPYLLIVPEWVEDRCVAEGTTAQDLANNLFRYVVEVEVV